MTFTKLTTFRIAAFRIEAFTVMTSQSKQLHLLHVIRTLKLTYGINAILLINTISARLLTPATNANPDHNPNHYPNLNTVPNLILSLTQGFPNHGS